MKKMKIKPTHHYQLVFPLLFSFFFYFLVIKAQQNMTSSTTTTTGITVDEFKVGVVLDMDSLVAKMGLTSMFMALSDFYSSTNNNTSHKTRLVLYTRNSNGDNVDAASAAIDLIKNVEVQAIIGPITSSQARFMVDLGNKTQVPMISFSATSPFVSPTKNPYFIRTAHNDTSQMKAIVAIVKAFGWKEVVPVYEDTEYGNGVIPYLTDAFQEIDTQVPYKSLILPSASDDEILIELNKLKTMRNRVFVVHMTPSLGSRVFRKAKKIGMMSEGYSWIITDGLANFLYSLDSSVIDSMQGVLGVRPYIPRSKELDTFRVRWKKKFLQENPYIESDEDLNVFGLWAYDTIWALATAVEKLKTMNNSRFLKAKVALNQTDIAALGVSHIGPKLLQEISNIKLKGLSGEFRLADRQLQSDIFQILNVHAEGGREIGLWTPSSGFLRDIIDSTTRTNNNASLTSSKDNLRPIIWPGDTVVMPKGLAVQTNEIQLRIGVPIKVGFNEFVNVRRNNNTNSTEFTGYCIDVFNAVMKRLPYVVTYKFFPFETQNGTSAGSYDDLIYQVYTKNYDAVVGDITIVANRSLYVDFTLPFTESGVSMIVPVKEDVRKKAWIFLKPLTMELWLTSGAFFILIGVVIWILKHRINNEFRGPVSHQLGTMFWFSFSTLVFAHREKVVSNLGRFVVIIWIFLVLILTSSYTASLTSMLTVHRLEPTITDINQLINNGDKVGYHEGSFVLGMLKHMGFDESNLKAFNNSEDFDLAFLPVSENNVNGGIVAAFDEIPYIKLLLARYCAKYTTVGPSYKTDGFGFAFQRGSPLVPDISRAILNVTQEDNMTRIEQSWFGNQQSCPEPNPISSDSLSLDSFWGLFLIAGASSVLALLIFLVIFLYEHHQQISISGGPGGTSFWQKIKVMVRHFDQKDFLSYPFRRTSGEVQDGRSVEVATSVETASPNVIGRSFSRLSNSNNRNNEELCPQEDPSFSYASDTFGIDSNQELSSVRQDHRAISFIKRSNLRTYSNPEISSIREEAMPSIELSNLRT